MSAPSTTTGEVGTPPAPPAGTSPWVRLATANVLWILLILIGLVVAFTSIQPNFLQPFNIRSIFADQSYLIVLAIGETFVIVTAGIDLSIGGVLIFSGVIAGKVMLALYHGQSAVGATNASWPIIIIGVLAGLASGLAWGLLNGFLVAKAGVPPLIVTLGTLGMTIGGSYLLTGGTDLRGIPTRFTNLIGFGTVGGEIPYQVVIALVVAVACGLLLAYTRFGRYTYAIGSNAEAARRVGIGVDRHLLRVYALMGLLAGVAGCMNLAHYTTTTIAGHTADNLGAISAAVIGGTSLFGGRGTVAGTIIGVLIPATLASGFVIIGVNPYWQYVAVGVVLIGAVYLDQLRRRTRERN
ncbi:MAG: ribose transport system permease protein [Micromonosporaceae bacterium]|jgi:ribose transport system permease protein|nr:ribose transport system permease protein [Micromonosporaceae bacterium]